MTKAAPGREAVFALSACIFLHRQGEILILKRADGIESGGWFAPGGHVEYGESPPETACRETFEEIGIRVAPETLRLLETYTIFPSEGLHHLGIVYLAPFPGGDVMLNEEHTGFRWVAPEYYRDRFLDPDRLAALNLPQRSLATAREMHRVVEALIAVLGGQPPA